MELLARLTEELGELSREVQHVYGMKKKKSGEAVRSLRRRNRRFVFCSRLFCKFARNKLRKSTYSVMEKFKVRDANRWTKKEEQ